MSLVYRTIYRNCYYLHNITKPVKWSIAINGTTRILASGTFYQNRYFHKWDTIHINSCPKHVRQYSLQQQPCDKPPQENEVKKEGMIKKLKQMYKDYWYVVLPVHMATSCIWFGCFYYAVKSGVDVVGILQSIGISESILTPLRESKAGYFALALALYKLMTPVRYAVTVGSTTYAIKKLTSIGWIRPVPSRERLKEMYIEKKDTIKDRINESKQHYQSLRSKKRTQVMEEMQRYKADLRNLKNKIKPQK